MNPKQLVPLLSLALAALLAPAAARAHCDTLDGPVVVAAKAALESGKLSPVLAWVQPADEAEIKAAFAKTRAARKAGGEAREVADTWFLETLVRVHRAGEGAPYTGLKPAGADLDPAVVAMDRAIAKGDPAEVERLLQAAVHQGLEKHWTRLAAEKAPADDVAAGRRWVAAYVPLVHWAEGVNAAATQGGAHAGHAEAGAADPHAAHAKPGARAPAADPHAAHGRAPAKAPVKPAADTHHAH
ncbi:conserved hypothetical protein [Anaeromyxobacter sp. K]|uniref:DUF6448 family protein n=1 Tax=Anaeromyxobacter sp. (strain K) TaxID=447217 RepID=UPI00017BE20C|nr:DUF6448 family protein [Anaeromyxobacter sp. K]ACG71720.1 conserved hypothetical protein [Anaeromyxobacter sp. K]